MEVLQQIWEQGSTQIIIIAIVMVVWMVGMIIYFNVRKKNTTGKESNFLEQYPSAAKVYLSRDKNNGYAIVKVHSVDGEKPVEFPDLKYPGFYLKPGKNSCEISFEYSEYVSKKRTITHSTGIVKKAIEVEANKSYLLTFDIDNNEFVFELYNK